MAGMIVHCLSICAETEYLFYPTDGANVDHESRHILRVLGSVNVDVRVSVGSTYWPASIDFSTHSMILLSSV